MIPSSVQCVFFHKALASGTQTMPAFPINNFSLYLPILLCPSPSLAGILLPHFRLTATMKLSILYLSFSILAINVLANQYAGPYQVRDSA